MGIEHLPAASVQFSQPWLGLLAILVVAPILIAVAAGRKGRRVGKISVAAQCLVVLLAAGALAQPSAVVGPRANLPWMAARDVSASTAGQADPLKSWPADLPREDFHFAQSVVAGAGPTSQPASAGVSAASFADETNLSPVLRLAAAKSKDYQVVVLATDGQWQDDWTPAAKALASAGTRLAIVPLDSPPADGRIAAFRVRRTPDGVVELTVFAAANSPMRRRLTLYREGLADPLLDRELVLLAESPATFRLADAPPADRAIRYRAALDAGDRFPQNDAMSADALPLKQTVAFVAGVGSMDLSANLAGGAQTVRKIPSADAPQTAAGWADYSAVVLMNARGGALSPASRAALAEYIRSGGGLVLVGAGPAKDPADRDDPLNAVSALVANPYQRSPMALTVVLDASGSMAELPADGAGPSKFDLAAQAVLSLKRHLTASDSLTVIAYAQTPRNIYDSGGGRPDFTKLADALAGVRPVGSTQVMPALELAAGQSPQAGKNGLVMLVSDLLTEPYKPADVEKVEKLFAENKLKLSIVATRSAGGGQPAETSLDVLAARLRAQFVRREGLAGLAEIFQQFLSKARGDAISHGKFEAAFQPDAMGLTDFRLPTLDAYILAGTQDNAEVLAAVGSDPLLARRQVGMGRSVTLAIPVGSDGNAALADSRQLPELLASAVRWAQRPGEDNRFDANVHRLASKWTLTLHARDDKGPMNLLKLTADVYGEQDIRDSRIANRELDLDQVGVSAPFRSRLIAAPYLMYNKLLLQAAPGIYQTTFDSPAVAVIVRDADGRIVWRGTMESSYGPEFSAVGPNWDNLHKLADITGGQIVQSSDLPRLTRSLAESRRQPLWPALLGLALLVMLADWVAGRILRT